jgi:Methyltransferase domain
MPVNSFDERIATRYQVLWPELFDPAVIEPAVDFLARLAGPGPALELGIGTGRIALPLSARGTNVHGIEISSAMIEELRSKPGAGAISVTNGDFANVRVDRSFRLVYLLRNTITNLTTQEEQAACFANVATHLEPGGLFVVENYVPELRRLPPGEAIYPFKVTPSHVGFEEYDFANQIAVSHHWWAIDGKLTTFSTPHRYVWPSEMDLMARIAGLTLSERWEDWGRRPFTGDSRNHISTWAKPA